MKIEWLQACQFEMVTGFNEETEETTVEDVFVKEGDIDNDVCPIAYHKATEDGESDTAGFEYAKGCIYGIPCELFEILEGKEELEAVA